MQASTCIPQGFLQDCVCEDISAQKKKDSMNLTPLEPMDVEELTEIGLDNLHDSDVDNYSWMAADDVTGEKLDPKLLIRVEARPDLFAATPPTECMRLLASKFAENK